MRSGLWAIALGIATLWQIPSCGGRSLTQEPGTGGSASASASGGSLQGGTGASGGVVARGGTAAGGVVARGGTAAGGAPRGGSGTGATGGTISCGGTGVDGGDGGFSGDDPTGGTSGTGTGGTGGVVPRPAVGVCPQPRPWSSNIELCGTGFVHRPVASACTPPLRDNACPNLPANAGVENLQACALGRPYWQCTMGTVECTRDADCGTGRYCLRDTVETIDGDDVVINHRCFEPCRTDADCGPAELCACDYAIQNATLTRVSLGMCKPAECRTDADCQANGSRSLCEAPLEPLMKVYHSWPPDLPRASTFITSFHCQSPDDECFGPESCPVFDPSGIDCCPMSACNFTGSRFDCDAVDTCDLCLLSRP
jgi:Cys-rich repeat protein